jgi:hypothetical protein
MKTKILNKLKKFVALKKHIADNHHIWNSIIEIESAAKKFISNVDKMNELKSSIDIDLKSIIDKKEQYKKTLLKEGMPVINVLMVYARENRNKSLSKLLNQGKKKIEDLKDTKLLNYFKAISKESKKLYTKSLTGKENENLQVEEIKSILNYGLNGNMVDNLEEEKINFEHAYFAYTEAKSQKIKDLLKFKILSKKNSDLLKNKIDLLVSVFEKTDPGFYKQYKALRHNVKKAKGKIKIKVKSSQPKSNVKKIDKIQKIDEKDTAKLSSVGNTDKKSSPVKKTQVKPAIKQKTVTAIKKSKPKPKASTTKSKVSKPRRKPVVKKVEKNTTSGLKTQK